MLHVDKVSDLAGFLALEPIWNAALAQSADRHAFLGFDFLRTEWQCLGWDRPLPRAFDTFVLVVKDGPRVAGLLPLVRYRTRFGGVPVTMLRVLGRLSMRRGAILTADPGPVLTAALEYLARHEAWTLFELFPLAADSELVKWLPQACSTAGLPLHLVDSHESPYIEVAGGWADYFKARSRNFHQTLKNKVNRLTRQGGFRCAAYHTPDDGEASLPVLLASTPGAGRGATAPRSRRRSQPSASTRTCRGPWRAAASSACGSCGSTSSPSPSSITCCTTASCTASSGRTTRR